MKKRPRKPAESDLDAPAFRIAPYRVEQITPDPPASPFANLKAINFPSIWEVTKGKGVKIAVLDTGVGNHSALEPSINRKMSRNFTGSGAPNDVRDENKHGTLVAGVIAARRNVGVAPDSELFIGKVMRRLSDLKVAALLDAICWAIDRRVNLINLSLGICQEPCQEIRTAIETAVSNGIFVICAAGNGGMKGVDCPAQYEECVAVGAIDLTGQRRWEGTASEGQSAVGDELDIVARGELIYSTLPDGNYGKVSGTSMAAPFVTGVIALALAKPLVQDVKSPIKTQKQLLEHLRLTARHMGSPKEFGFGEIDPEKLFNSVM